MILKHTEKLNTSLVQIIMARLEDCYAMNFIQWGREVGPDFHLTNMIQIAFLIKHVMMKHTIIDLNPIMVLDSNFFKKRMVN